MKTIKIILAAATLATLPLYSLTSLTGCASTAGYIQTAQAWLNDPKNQQLINEIAQAAINIIGAFSTAKATTNATVTGKLAQAYPNVPAGALAQIAANPQAYARK